VQLPSYKNSLADCRLYLLPARKQEQPVIATVPIPRSEVSAADLAHRIEACAAELAGFLDGADLDGGLELDVVAHQSAVSGLLERAMARLETAGPGER
jgi:hypothetical protein